MTEQFGRDHAIHGQEIKHNSIASREKLRHNAEQLTSFQHDALHPSVMRNFEHADAQLLIGPQYEGRPRFNPLLADIYKAEYPEAEKPMFRVHCLQQDIITMNHVLRGALHNFQPGYSRQYLDFNERIILENVYGVPEGGALRFPHSFSGTEGHTVEKRRMHEGMCYPMRLATAAITPRRVVSYECVDAETLHQGLQYCLNLSDEDMEFSQELTTTMDSLHTR